MIRQLDSLATSATLLWARESEMWIEKIIILQEAETSFNFFLRAVLTAVWERVLSPADRRLNIVAIWIQLTFHSAPPVSHKFDTI